MAEVTLAVGPSSGGVGTATLRMAITGAYTAGGDWSPQMPSQLAAHGPMSYYSLALSATTDTAIAVPTAAAGCIILPDYETGTVGVKISATASTGSHAVPFKKTPWCQGWEVADRPANLYAYADGATTIRVIFY